MHGVMLCRSKTAESKLEIPSPRQSKIKFDSDDDDDEPPIEGVKLAMVPLEEQRYYDDMIRGGNQIA